MLALISKRQEGKQFIGFISSIHGHLILPVLYVIYVSLWLIPSIILHGGFEVSYTGAWIASIEKVCSAASENIHPGFAVSNRIIKYRRFADIVERTFRKLQPRSGHRFILLEIVTLSPENELSFMNV